MKETDYLNFKSTDLLTKCELKLFYDRDPLYKAKIITSKLIRYFYFNEKSQLYHTVKDEMPMNIKNINEYIVVMSRKLLLQSMIQNKLIRTNSYEKQINYFYDLVGDIKLSLIINKPLNYIDSDSDDDEDSDSDDDEDSDSDSDSDDDEDEETEQPYRHFSLNYIKNKLKIARYDTSTVNEIIESLN